MAEVAVPVEAAPVVVAPVAKEEVFAVAHIFASFNDTFVVSRIIPFKWTDRKTAECCCFVIYFTYMDLAV
jgi:hypothetical protein